MARQPGRQAAAAWPSHATGPRSAPGPSLVAIDVTNTDGNHVRQLSRPPHGYEDHLPRLVTGWPDDRLPARHRRQRYTRADEARRREHRHRDRTGRLPAPRLGAGLRRCRPRAGWEADPLGFWCIYGDSCPASLRAERNATLATIHPDGRGLRLLQLKSGADSGAWSPDGKRIVFRCRSGAGPLSFRLCTSNLNGTGFRRFPWPVGSAEPDWGTHP